jgi:hypothetical protein
MAILRLIWSIKLPKKQTSQYFYIRALFTATPSKRALFSLIFALNNSLESPAETTTSSFLFSEQCQNH